MKSSLDIDIIFHHHVRRLVTDGLMNCYITEFIYNHTYVYQNYTHEWRLNIDTLYFKYPAVCIVLRDLISHVSLTAFMIITTFCWEAYLVSVNITERLRKVMEYIFRD